MMTTGEIADRMAITEAIYRYCRAMDRIDAELGHSVWHEDGEADYGAIYRGSGRGFVDWACVAHRTMLATSHRVTNVLVTLDADRAASESYVVATLRRMDGSRLVQTSAWGATSIAGPGARDAGRSTAATTCTTSTRCEKSWRPPCRGAVVPIATTRRSRC